MISLDDCISLSGMTEEQILAIAEHEHISEIEACALADYLRKAPEGYATVRTMIIEDIREAQSRGDREHVRELLHVLHHFLRQHPEARPEVHPWSSVF